MVKKMLFSIMAVCICVSVLTVGTFAGVLSSGPEEKLTSLSSGLIFDLMGNESTTSSFSLVKVNTTNGNMLNQTNFLKSIEGHESDLGLTHAEIQFASSNTTYKMYQSINTTFNDMIKMYENYDASKVQQIKKLKNLFKTDLKNSKMIFIYRGDSNVEHFVYFLGVDKDGSIVGLKTSIIWT